MSLLSLLPSFLKIAIMVLEEVFLARYRARERKEKWDATQMELAKATERALERFKIGLIEDTKKAKDMQDQIDQELRKGRQSE